MTATVCVTFSVSQDVPVPNGAPSVSFADLLGQTYTVAVYDSSGTLVGTQTITTATVD